MEPFFDLFLQYTKELESPTSFFRWASYSIVAGILRDNVYFEQITKKRVYPNIYVLLIAPSAEHRKSVPVLQAIDLLREVRNTKLVSGRVSIQAVIEELTKVEIGKIKIQGGSCVLLAEEMAAFFIEDHALVGILTDLYDFKKEYDLKHVSSNAGSRKATNVCVTLLAASNEILLKSIYTEAAVYGGLLGRTFFVKPDEFRPGNSLMWGDLSSYDSKYIELVKSLKKISDLRGPVTFSEDAKQEYDRWYQELRESYRNKPERSGILGRIHAGALKLAIILGLGSNYETHVTLHNMKEAIFQCTQLLPNYDTYMLRSSGSDKVQQTSGLLLVSLYGAEKNLLSRKEFLYAHWNETDATTLDQSVTTLQQAGMIEIALSNQNEAAYSLTKKAMNYFKKASTNGNNEKVSGVRAKKTTQQG